MTDMISPKYQMQLVAEVSNAIWKEFNSYENVSHYIEKWHIEDQNWNNHWENFQILTKDKNGEIDLTGTLHGMKGDILLKIAIDLGVETPDFIPSIPTFRNEIKSDYKTASATFEKAFRQIEEHPETAIGLANSALESIVKEILKDERIGSKIKGNETLYSLSSIILKEFRFLSKGELPKDIKTIGNSLVSINQSIENLRSEMTDFHGKTTDDYVIKDSIYTYFVVNCTATVGLFLNSYYKKKFPKHKTEENISDELPF